MNSNYSTTLPAIISAAVAAVLLLLLSGCGVSAGPLAIGTTGFLKEHNRLRLHEVDSVENRGS